MAGARRTAPSARTLLAFLSMSTILSVSALKYTGSGRAYEWDEVHTAKVREDSSKGVCFEKGVTTCVSYTLKANKPIIAFVALRSEAKASLDGANSSRYVDGSVCTGKVCDVKVEVSERHSYCLVMLNRHNEEPAFSSSSGPVTIEFKVNGCPATFWAIIAAVVVIVLMIALFACCGACCVHFVRNRSRQQLQGPQMNPQGGPLAPGQMIAPMPMYQQDMGAQQFQYPPQVALGTPQPQPIQFLEAKL